MADSKVRTFFTNTVESYGVINFYDSINEILPCGVGSVVRRRGPVIVNVLGPLIIAVQVKPLGVSLRHPNRNGHAHPENEDITPEHTSEMRASRVAIIGYVQA